MVLNAASHAGGRHPKGCQSLKEALDAAGYESSLKNVASTLLERVGAVRPT